MKIFIFRFSRFQMGYDCWILISLLSNQYVNISLMFLKIDLFIEKVNFFPPQYPKCDPIAKPSLTVVSEYFINRSSVVVTICLKMR